MTFKKNEKISTHPNFRDLLKTRRIIDRSNTKYQNLLQTTELKDAAKQFYNNPDIIIGIGDKANVYTILNKTHNNEKIENILIDKTEFKKLTKNPNKQNYHGEQH